jgi:hypothetical protein
MNTILLKRGDEIALRLMKALASHDCLNLHQCVAAVYGNHAAAAFAGMQRKMKKMLEEGLIGRKKSDDGLYRYYLQTAGVRIVNEHINFVATPGHDRSYINASRYDKIINKIIADSYTFENETRALGRGALRRIKEGKFKDIDGMLGVLEGEKFKTVKIYAKIDAPNIVGIDKFERMQKRALQLDTKLVVISNEYTFKTLTGKK